MRARITSLLPTRLFDWVLVATAATATLVVAGAWLFPYSLTRTGTWYDHAAWISFMVRALGVHIGIALIVVLAVALLRHRWILGVVTASLIAFLLLPLVQLPSVDDQSTASLEVMSANVLYSNTHYDEMLRHITKVDPDVLVLQEYTLGWDRKVGAKLRHKYRYVADRSDRGLRGLAIFSKLPIVNHRDVGAVEGVTRPQLEATIRTRSGDIAVINAHPLTSMSVRKGALQRRQIHALLQSIRREKRPLVVAGDMNFTETSSAYSAFRAAGLRSGWDQAGDGGRGATWHFHRMPAWFPGLRLDHVFTSKDVSVVVIRIDTATASDHRGIVAHLNIHGQ